jgi:hypothetical protein
MINRLWSISANPVAGTVATATLAAAPGVQHFATGITVTWVVSTALAGGQTVNIYLRDGLTGAGAILWVAVLGLPGTAPIGSFAQVVPQGLMIQGTEGNAMTIEFSAGVGSTLQAVNLNGYDQS